MFKVMVTAMNVEPGGGMDSPRLKMQGDPWTRKKTMMVLAIMDLFLALFLTMYAGFRLLQYDWKDQTLMAITFENEYIILSVLYWLVVFGILFLQLVIAFLLLSATNDMTIDPESMIKKCEWWRITSFVFFILIVLDLMVLLYEAFILPEGNPKIIRLTLSTFELLFRIYGIYFVGKFIRDLHTLFVVPMSHFTSGNNPNMPTPIIAPRCPVVSQRGIV